MKTLEELIRISKNIIYINNIFSTGKGHLIVDDVRYFYSNSTHPWYSSFYVRDFEPEWDCISYSRGLSTVTTISSMKEHTHTLDCSEFDLSEEMLFQYSTMYSSTELEAIFVKVYLDKFTDIDEFCINLSQYPSYCEKLGLIP
ncbi:hypothetical protein DIDNDMLP_00291 [Klebsiella phage KP13-7]|nr:hypothetical protein DIDNDMLP_00291 [Klebsiella phage KP13-7]